MDDKLKRWLSIADITEFLNTLSETAIEQKKEVNFYLFGGAALVMHGLREKTHDIDSVTLINNQIDKEFYDATLENFMIKKNINKEDNKYYDTYNDININPNASRKEKTHLIQYIHSIVENGDKNLYQKIKIGEYLELNLPTQEYLLTYKLAWLASTWIGNKKNLDHKGESTLIDAKSLFTSLKINQGNYPEKLNPILEQNFYNATHPLEQNLSIWQDKFSKAIEEVFNYINIKPNITLKTKIENFRKNTNDKEIACSLKIK